MHEMSNSNLRFSEFSKRIGVRFYHFYEEIMNRNVEFRELNALNGGHSTYKRKGNENSGWSGWCSKLALSTLSTRKLYLKPMSQFSQFSAAITAITPITALNHESKFAKAYDHVSR